MAPAGYSTLNHRPKSSLRKGKNWKSSNGAHPNTAPGQPVKSQNPNCFNSLPRRIKISAGQRPDMPVCQILLEINHWQSRGAYVRNLFPLPESGQRKSFMSQHRSLRAIATVGGKRNVLKRFERVGLLKKRGQWKDGERITGLR